MSVAVSLPPSGSPQSMLLLRRFSVDEYHQMVQTGILNEDEPVELLEGSIVIKMPRNPKHDLTLEKADVAIRERLPAGWRIRIQCAITTNDSEPEPDIAVVRGPLPSRTDAHPRPGEIALLVEVAESSLDRDRAVKGQTFARAAIPVYWIINLPDRQVEVYTDPTGPDPQPAYRTVQDYGETDAVPLVLDGHDIGRIPVRDLLP
jgi:Uma2 family endonuclease